MGLNCNEFLAFFQEAVRVLITVKSKKIKGTYI